MTIAEYKQMKPNLSHKDKEKIRLDIMERLMEKAQENPRTFNPPFSLCNSEPYRKLRVCIEDKKALPGDASFWDQLCNEISLHYPSFTDTFLILCDDNISVRNLRLMMLIKCGITPSQSCILLSREKGTVSYHRKQLRDTLFGDGVNLKDMDKLIHCM